MTTAEELRGKELKCLDHGYVRLVEWMGSDLAIARSARVSYNADWRVGDDEKGDKRLIDFLVRHRHTTPLESVVMTFEIKAPIFVFRQWHRHRTWSYNEISARYTPLPSEFYVPAPEDVCAQSKVNKQGRSEALPPHVAERIRENMRSVQSVAFDYYTTFMDGDDLARELSRAVLPVAIYSRMYATVDLHNLFHFIKLRIDPHAQKEIRVYAERLLECAEAIVPIAADSWKRHVLNAVTFSEEEIQLLRRFLQKEEPDRDHLVDCIQQSTKNKRDRDEFMAKLGLNQD